MAFLEKCRSPIKSEFRKLVLHSHSAESYSIKKERVFEASIFISCPILYVYLKTLSSQYRPENVITFNIVFNRDQYGLDRIQWYVLCYIKCIDLQGNPRGIFKLLVILEKSLSFAYYCHDNITFSRKTYRP